MSTYSLSHLSDGTLLSDLVALVARDRSTTAELLAHIAEVDARKLYLPAAYASMYAYCVSQLHMSEDAACRRIRAARAARHFPGILSAVAEGRLHLSAVVLLAPHLTPETADGLLAAAVHRTRAEIEQLLAQRFPRPDLPTQLEPVSQPPFPTSTESPALVRLGLSAPARIDTANSGGLSAPARIDTVLSAGVSAPARMEAPVPRPRLAPLAPQRFALQVTIGQRAHDNLHYAQALLGHQVATGNIADVLDQALDLLVRHLEKRRFAATTRPRLGARRPTGDRRYVPAEVKRVVWKRDGGRCTFVSDTGQRCTARTRLEFDHVTEFARGGHATVSGIRLRCRAHNQYGAERTFGTEFMRHKRQESRCAAEARTQAEAAAERARERDVIPWLRQLGFRVDEARRGAAACENIPNASLEERVRVALTRLAPGHRRTGAGVGSSV